MKPRTLVPAILACTALLYVACGGSETPPPKTEPAKAEPAKAEPAKTEPAKTEPPPVPEPKVEKKVEPPPPPPPPKKVAKDILLGDKAVFMFSLDDSPDAKAAMVAACEKKAKKNDKKKEACIKAGTEAASTEGFRIEKDDKGNTFWVSFGTVKGKEVVFNKIEFTVSVAEDAKVTVTPKGKDLGKRKMKKLPAEMVFEVPDEKTVVINDPKKGKLTYKLKE
jgi:type IV secretory pathway VirB10-like protein